MAVIFDLDGTLVDSSKLNLRLISNGLKEECNISLPLSFMKKVIKYPYTSMKDIINKEYNLNLTMEDFKKVHMYKLRHLEEYVKYLKVMPGAKTLVRLLKKNGIKIGIFTSASDKEISIYKKKIKLLNDFDVIISSNMRREKPDPYYLLKTLKALNAKKESSVYIGDAEVDYHTAQNAGIKFIGMFNRDLPNHFLSYKSLYSYMKKNYKQFLD